MKIWRTPDLSLVAARTFLFFRTLLAVLPPGCVKYKGKELLHRMYHIWVCAGREKWLFNAIFLKVEPPCDQTWWDSLVFQLSVVYHMFWMPKTLWWGLWGHSKEPFWPFLPKIGCFWIILRSDYSFPVTKRVQLEMNWCAHNHGNCI